MCEFIWEQSASNYQPGDKSSCEPRTYQQMNCPAESESNLQPSEPSFIKIIVVWFSKFWGILLYNNRYSMPSLRASLMTQPIKNPPAMQETQETSVQSLGQEGPLRRKWQLTPVFSPVKSHGQRSLVSQSIKSHKESDTIEQLSMHAFSKGDTSSCHPTLYYTKQTHSFTLSNYLMKAFCFWVHALTENLLFKKRSIQYATGTKTDTQINGIQKKVQE